MPIRLIQGDCRDVLATLPADSVHCVVCSPPYWGLRDYGVPPSIWGGDPGCEHEWGDAIQKFGGGGQPGQKVRWQHTGAGVNGHAPADAGAFCARCGAWCGCLGLEPTPDLFVANIVDVFREVRRVLRPDGVCWVNMGDSYATGAGKVGDCPGGGKQGERWKGYRGTHSADNRLADGGFTQPNRMPIAGLKPKDLVGMPWRVAFALQAGFSTCSGCGTELRSDLWPVLNGHKVCITCLLEKRTEAKVIGTERGWWLRSDVVWSKPSPMHESVRDRPTKAHEYIFLLTKSARYFYDAEAVKEASTGNAHPRRKDGSFAQVKGRSPEDNRDSIVRTNDTPATRNLRSVWTIQSHPFPDAHFATFAPALAETCIKAGTSERGCCQTCGAPWRRVTRVAYDNPGNRTTNGPRSVENLKITAGFAQRLERRAETMGWEPGCTCPPASPVPCTVLDPFVGSGTSMLVADRLQRNGIGIDLSLSYVEMATNRIVDDAPLLPAVEGR